MILVLNNCAEIHYHDCDYFQTEMKRQQMIVLLRGERQWLERSGLLSDNDLYGIFANASFLTYPSTARAA